MSRITIFVGEFGSGKTELAVNYALALKAQGYSTAVVDIDLVKPYFRTRENRQFLEANGIYAVMPEERLAHAGLPIMPHDLTRILYDADYQVIMDVGGGESAIVLGQIHRQLAENPYEALLVVNTCRPFTGDKQGVVRAFERIQHVSRLNLRGLVVNTNLAGETTVKHVQEGIAIVEEAAEALILPIKWVVVPEWLAGKVETDHPIFVLKPYTHYPWMEQWEAQT